MHAEKNSCFAYYEHLSEKRYVNYATRLSGWPLLGEIKLKYVPLVYVTCHGLNRRYRYEFMIFFVVN
jgi:hypothetical protein